MCRSSIVNIIFIKTILFSGLFFLSAEAQFLRNNPGVDHANKFEELGPLLPTPNVYRSANGAPGPSYWQQRADYTISCELDEKAKILTGEELVTYYNNSPDILNYLWLELSENQHHPKNHFSIRGAERVLESGVDSTTNLAKYDEPELQFRGLGIEILVVTGEDKQPLPYMINKTLMRIDLKNQLLPKGKVKFIVRWRYKMPERLKFDASRGGFEAFPDSNNIFTVVQWYPRLCVYNDYQGWDLLQFTGHAEFPLTFGDFDVKIKVPDDHVVAATGECQNFKEVLSNLELKRWNKAQNSQEPIEIVTLDEAKSVAKAKSPKGFKVWHYKASNVRDFAWTSSRRFMWDAMSTNIEGKKVMCMSLYPEEAEPIYRRYSTKSVAHALKVYSKYSTPYPYPVAISVEANNGMEYPMIVFNYGRVKKDGSYTQELRNQVVSVIIHEIGHNFFPMLINSNERRWAWMDEGFNSFVEFLAEQEFDKNFPSRRGPAPTITKYMRKHKKYLEPIMTAPDNVRELGNNVYGKTAAALNLLRETVMGRELFDRAFKEYCLRWTFKSPTPADFFRTMEDASGMDLSWFFRAWFFETDPVDISLDTVIVYHAKSKIIDSLDMVSKKRKFILNHITRTYNMQENQPTLVDLDKSLEPNPGIELISDDKPFLNYPNEKPLDSSGRYLYELILSNKGGAISPIIIEWSFADGTKEKQVLEAEMWRYNESKINRVFVKYKPVTNIKLDPDMQTADIDIYNNQVLPSAIIHRTLLDFTSKHDQK